MLNGIGIILGNRTIKKRFKLSVFLLINLVAYFLLALFSENKQIELFPVVPILLFWVVLIILPSIIDDHSIFSPINLTLFLFFMSMVQGVMLLPFLDIRIYWLQKFYAPDFWEHVNYTILLYCLAFVIFCLVFRFTPSVRLPKARVKYLDEGFRFSGLILIAAGIAGLTLLTGSLAGAMSLGGLRETAYSVLVEGSFKYVIWMAAVPIGSCILWYSLCKKYRLSKFSSILLALSIYIPLVPFYLYSSGRGRTIIPLILLIVLYDRFYTKIKFRWAVLAGIVMIPLMAFWALYRNGISFNELDPIENIGYVLVGDLSRFDITVCAVSGIKDESTDFFYGETLLSGVLGMFLVPSSLVGGTQALARVLHRDMSYSRSSPIASSLIIEGLINFGVFGIVFLFALLALFIKFLTRLFHSKEFIIVLLSILFFIYSPINSSFRISIIRLFWSSLFPVILAYGLILWMNAGLTSRTS